MTEKTETGAPSEARFNATFPAPPIRYSFLSTVTTGTGASGEILSTLPHQYASSIISPITPIFTEEKVLNSSLKSMDAILFCLIIPVTHACNIIQWNPQQGYNQPGPCEFRFINDQQ